MLFNKKPTDLSGEQPRKDFAITRKKVKRPQQKRAIQTAFGIDVSVLEEENFQITKSSSSCHIDQIKGIIFGGISSRFWMLRKHISSIQSLEKLRNLPFYSWNCLTLQLNHREVDLVVPDDHHMQALLKFLVYRIQTVDGNRGTAKNVLENLNNHSRREFLSQPGRHFMSKQREHQIRSTNEYRVYSKVMLKYSIMRVRSKLSYHALLNRQTVLEMFITQILKTFMLLTSIGVQHINIKYEEYVYDAIIRGDKDCLKKIVHQNRLKYDQNAILRKINERIKEMMTREEVRLGKNIKKFYVKKSGKLIKKKVDLDKQCAMENEIQDILKKDKCIDIFRDAYARLDPTFKYDANRIEKFTRYKFKKKSLHYLYKKLNLILMLGMLHGRLYLRV